MLTSVLGMTQSITAATRILLRRGLDLILGSEGLFVLTCDLVYKVNRCD